jgi:hypothetical protein
LLQVLTAAFAHARLAAHAELPAIRFTAACICVSWTLAASA